MKKAIIWIFVSFMIVSCQNSHDNDKSGGDDMAVGQEHKKISQSYQYFMKSVDEKIENAIQDKLTEVDEEISQTINESAKSATGDVSEEAKVLIVNAVKRTYADNVRKKSRRNYLSGLINEFEKKQHEFISSTASPDEDLTENEKEEIYTIVENGFNNTSPVESVHDESLQNAHQLLFQQNTLFSTAEKTATFNRKMKSYFSIYDPEGDMNQTSSYPFTGLYAYGKDSITNTFNGEDLTTREAVYENGKITKINKNTKEITFPSIDGSSPDEDEEYFGVDADIYGDGNRSLFILQKYKNGNYYPFMIGDRESGYSLKSLDNLKRDDTTVLNHVTDLAVGNFDEDAADEVVVGVSDGEKSYLYVFDDLQTSFVKMAKFDFPSKNVKEAIIRVATGDSDGDGIDEIAVVFYDSFYKAKIKYNRFYYFKWYSNSHILHTVKYYPFKTENLSRVASDVMFADIREANLYEPVVVIVDPNKEQEDLGYSQLEQAGSDDYCRFHHVSKNYLDLFVFSYNMQTQELEDPVSNQIQINNYTYDKQYNISGDNGADDGVKCFVGACHCDDDFKSKEYYLFGSIDKERIGQARDSFRKPIYITPIHTKPNEAALLDVDGVQFSFYDKIVHPAENYEKSGVDFNSEKKGYGKQHFVPVHTNRSGEYIVKMKEGQRYYTGHRPKCPPSTSINSKDSKESVYRVLEDDNEIERHSSYINDSFMMQYVGHSLLYTEPVFTMLLGAPPKVGNKTSMKYTTTKSDAHSQTDSHSWGAVIGAGVSGGVEAGGLGGEGVDLETQAKLKFETIQSRYWSNYDKNTTSYSIGTTASGGGEDLVSFISIITDVYRYQVIKDDANRSNVGHYLNITKIRNESGKSKKTKYEDVTSVNTLYKNLSDHNLTPYIDLKALMQHDSSLPESYLTEDHADELIKHPDRWYPSIYADKEHDYSGVDFDSSFWHPDKSALVPDYGKLDFVYSHTDATGKGAGYDSKYKLTATLAFTAKEGVLVHAVEEAEVTLGIQYTYKNGHSDSESTKTSYQFSADNNGTDRGNLDRVAFFSFLATPQKNNCKLDDLKPLSPFDDEYKKLENTELNCYPPLLVIDYWRTNNNDISSIGVIDN